jgi:hypothetical protein
VVVVLLCLEPPKFKTLFKMSTGDGYCCLGGSTWMDWMPLHLSSHYYGVLLRIQSRAVSSAKLPTCTAHMGALLGIVSMDYRQLSLSIFFVFFNKKFRNLI